MAIAATAEAVSITAAEAAKISMGEKAQRPVSPKGGTVRPEIGAITGQEDKASPESASAGRDDEFA